MTINQKNLKHSFFMMLAITLIILQITAFLPFHSLGVPKTVYAWNGSDTSKPDGLGTQVSPYMIKTAEELFWVSEQYSLGSNEVQNAYFELGATINLEDYEWLPIGSYEGNDAKKAFNGVFDGKDFSIYNFNIKENSYVYNGLFGYVSGTIKNLRVTQIDIDLDLTSATSASYVGGVAGYLANNAVISRVLNGGTIIARGAATEPVYLGGIAGFSARAELNQTINNVLLSVETVSTVYAGGLVGKTENVTIKTSYNKQVVNLTSSNIAHVGGIVGEAYQTKIEKVFNEANITAKSAQVYVGGIAGLVSSSGGATIYEQKYLYNTKKVALFGTEALQENLFVGGLFGKVETNNKISFVYHSDKVEVSLLGEPTTKKGSLIGAIDLGAIIENSYFNYAERVGDLNGIGINNSEQVSVLYISNLTNMKVKTSFVDWDFTNGGIWLMSGNLNDGLPALRLVGNYAVHAQISGGGKISTLGISYYTLGISPVYTIEAYNGNQVKYIILNNKQIDTYRGDGKVSYNVQNNGMPPVGVVNLAVTFEPFPFVKTQMFYYIVVVGTLIVIMIVGTAIINHNYAVKMDKLMEEKKKALKINPDEILEDQKDQEEKEEEQQPDKKPVKKHLTKAEQLQKEIASKKHSMDELKLKSEQKTHSVGKTCAFCGKLNDKKSLECKNCGADLK